MRGVLPIRPHVLQAIAAAVAQAIAGAAQEAVADTAAAEAEAAVHHQVEDNKTKRLEELLVPARVGP
jgi:hypothetical protein